MSNDFGTNLKSIREERGLSQEQFAALLGTSKQVISRYENNQRSPKVSTVVEYAEILNEPLSRLTGYRVLGHSPFSDEQLEIIRERLYEMLNSEDPVYEYEYGYGHLMQGISDGEVTPSYDDLLKIADSFGCSIEYILGWTDDSSPPGSIKPATISGDGLEEKIVNLLVNLHQEKQAEAVRYLEYLASTAEESKL